MLKVTSTAVEQIYKELKSMIPDIKDPYIRLNMGIGWSGPSLRLALEESRKPNEDDTVTEVEGIHLLVSKDQLFYFTVVELDFRKNIFNSGEYKLNNMWLCNISYNHTF